MKLRSLVGLPAIAFAVTSLGSCQFVSAPVNGIRCGGVGIPGIRPEVTLHVSNAGGITLREAAPGELSRPADLGVRMGSMECGTSPGRNTDIGVTSDEDLLILMNVADVVVRVVDEDGEVRTRYEARPGFGEVVLNR